MRCYVNYVETFWAKIYIAGPRDAIEQECRKYCFENPLCVTVEDAKYIYKGGEEAGVVVGIVNYPRFPKTPKELEEIAKKLANRIMEAAYQESYMVVTPERSMWYTRRATNMPSGRFTPEGDRTPSPPIDL